MASVPITVLLYPLLCVFNVPVKGLIFTKCYLLVEIRLFTRLIATNVYCKNISRQNSTNSTSLAVNVWR